MSSVEHTTSAQFICHVTGPSFRIASLIPEGIHCTYYSNVLSRGEHSALECAASRPLFAADMNAN